MTMQHVNPFDPPEEILDLEANGLDAIVIQGLGRAVISQDQVEQKLDLAQIGVCDVYIRPSDRAKDGASGKDNC